MTLIHILYEVSWTATRHANSHLCTPQQGIVFCRGFGFKELKNKRTAALFTLGLSSRIVSPACSTLRKRVLQVECMFFRVTFLFQSAKTKHGCLQRWWGQWFYRTTVRKTRSYCQILQALFRADVTAKGVLDEGDIWNILLTVYQTECCSTPWCDLHLYLVNAATLESNL